MKRRWLIVVLLLFLITSSCSPKSKILQNGQYSVAGTLKGGSGRAGIESPVHINVTNGQATAMIIWSSPFYEWMKIDGVEYKPIQSEGNAKFEIPISFDTDIPLSAQTIAMSEPHVIDYILHFDSSTLTSQD